MSIHVEHLSKSFPGTQALDDVSLSVEPGQIHALLGANGSGKSTLVKVLTGVYQPDSGWIQIGDQRRHTITSPGEAERLGIRVVHQEAPLVDTLSVAECVALFRGYPTRGMGRIRWSKLTATVQTLFDRLEIPIDPHAFAYTLSPAERAMVALAIALVDIDTGVNLLVLDEATASLYETDAEVFLERVGAIARSGVAVLMVTHRLKEVVAVADVVTVLANGRIAHAGKVTNLNEELVVSKMVGQPVHTSIEEGASTPDTQLGKLWVAAGRDSDRQPVGRDILHVAAISGTLLRSISFTLHGGEILGITGIPDSGVGELPLLLAGAANRAGGTIRINGNELRAHATPREAIRSGIALVPSDRLRQGGVTSLPIRENMVLPEATRYWHRARQEHDVVHTAIGVMDVRPPREEALFSSLSGGNQQKVILAKWLLLRPSVLILDDPTSGVDPGARRKIFETLRDAARHGVGILFFSTEPEQLVTMCERVLVLRKGEIAAELRGDDLTTGAIVHWSYA